MILGPMNREELEAAIVRPAERQRVAFEEGLVARILDDVESEPGNLPLLEFALTQLWERQQGGLLTHAAYEAIGEVEGALVRYADRVYEDLSEPEQEQARQVFVQLVRPGEGTEDTRKADSLCHDYMIIEDIFPTFLEMAGVNDYEQIGGKIDGVSIVPLLRRKSGYPKDRSLFWHFPHNYSTGKPHSAIRKGDWKLIYFHADLHYELYNLKDDIGESNNLAGKQGEVVKRLAKELGEFLADADAVMPINRETGRLVPLPA